MNNITLTGRLTADVELKKTTSGVSVCSFTIAVKRPHVKDVTDFIDCTAWRSTAEFVAKYFGKGKSIGVCGMLASRKYEDKNGNKRTAHEVIVDNVEFIGDKSAAQSAEDDQPREMPQEEPPQINDDDLPF